MEQVSAFALLWAAENMPCDAKTEWLERGDKLAHLYWCVLDSNWWSLVCLLEAQTSKKDST